MASKRKVRVGTRRDGQLTPRLRKKETRHAGVQLRDLLADVDSPLPIKHALAVA